MDKFFDKYVWFARVWPAFLTCLPIFAAFWAWDPKIEAATRPLVSAALGAGAIALLASLARGAGKRAEERLAVAWGGMPTTLMLRHSDATLEKGTKLRYHGALTKMVPTTRAPMPEQEAVDGAGADQVYKTWTRYLLGQTRDKKIFGLIFAENMEYGFRRNLFGLRTLGGVISLTSASACGWKVAAIHRAGTPPPFSEIACLLGCTAMFAIWVFAINQQWVWQGGKAYALKLFEAIDQLQDGQKGPR